MQTSQLKAVRMTANDVIGGVTKQIDKIYADHAQRHSGPFASPTLVAQLPLWRRACDEMIAQYTATVPTLNADDLADVADAVACNHTTGLNTALSARVGQLIKGVA